MSILPFFVGVLCYSRKVCPVMRNLISGIILLFLPVIASAADISTLQITLADAVKMAVEKNLDVKVELYNPAIQEAEIRKNLGVYDPSLSVQANYLNSTTANVILGTPNPQGSQTSQFNAGISQLFFTGGTATFSFNNTYYSNDKSSSTTGYASYWQSALGITLSQPLLKNFGREATELNIDVSMLGKKASMEHFQQKLITTVAQVRTEYYKLYSLRRERDVKKVSLDLARKILVETQARVKAGVMPSMEVLNAEFGVASRERELIDAERAVNDQVDLLRQLLQASAVVDIETLEVPSNSAYEISEQDEIKRAIETRPELKELRYNLQMAELQARVAGNKTRPDLALTASASSTGLDRNFNGGMDRLATFDYPAWGVGFAFSYPIGNSNAENEYRKSRLKIEQARLKIRNQEELVANEVRAAVRAVTSNFKQLEVADRGRRFAEERFRAFARKVEVGLATNKDLLDVENDLATAKNNQIKALVSYANAVTQLWKSGGVLLEKENVRLVGNDADALYKDVR